MRRSRNRKKSGSKIVSTLLLLGFLAGAGYVYTAPEFERVSPTLEGADTITWNRKDPLKLKVSDNIGLKDFELVLSDGLNSLVVGRGNFDTGTKEKVLLVKYPQSKLLDQNSKSFTLKVIVTDSSMWNFFQGNTLQKTLDVKIDYKRPNVNILSNSYSITQGGSALVVFQAEDENLDELYIQAGGKKFKVQPYKKEGYYASLLAWPFNESDFSAKIIATDTAENRRVTVVPLFLRNYNYKVSWIRAKDKFIDGKITDLAASDPEYADIDNKLDKLRAVNESMRLNNENLIHALGVEVSDNMLDKWKMKKFYPLKGGVKVASYGDHRHYYYNTKEHKVSESYHVGYDLASTKMAIVKSSNAGKVVYADNNGIYGYMPMIDHGLGLYTLYGHCSTLLVKEGDEVDAGQAIAKTGVSG